MLKKLSQIKLFVDMVDREAPASSYRNAIGISKNDLKYHIKLLSKYREMLKDYHQEDLKMENPPAKEPDNSGHFEYLSSKLFGSTWTNYAGNWKELIEEIGSKNIHIKTLLNIGVGGGLSSIKWNKFLFRILNLQSISNLEMELPLVEKALSSKEELLNDTRHGIAQEALKIYGPLSFDAVFWSHGPEHITRGEWKDCFSQLEKVARYCVILQCPWGSGYDYDEGHVSPSIQENEFEKFGYKVMYNGVKNTRDAGILSVKYVMEGL